MTKDEGRGSEIASAIHEMLRNANDAGVGSRAKSVSRGTKTPRGTALSFENLTALGAERLARIMLEEAESNPSFRKRLKAALAATKGPDAVAKLVDRRLAALERARAMVAWEKERAFAEDLGTMLDTIVKELAPLSPGHAVERLIRFIDTHGSVFDRIDDSGGRIQDVYWRAGEAVPELVGKLSPAERARLPDRLLQSIKKDTHGLAPGLAISVVPLLSEPALVAWDQTLQQLETDNPRLLEIRQAIADTRGDIDGFLALELRRPEWLRDPLKVAERLLAANRLDEALLWARRDRKGGLTFMSEAGFADGRGDRLHDLQRVDLEARILEATKDRPAAQALRWTAFEATLNVEILRDYIRKLDDFIEHEEQDRAFAIAMNSPHVYTALGFFVAWPRLDLAARLVLDKRDIWEGRHYGLLGEAASVLAEDFPAAATILLRALLDDILARGKSPAYGHGARYLERLDELSPRVADDTGLTLHADYMAQLRKTHGRKYGFWSLVADERRR